MTHRPALAALALSIVCVLGIIVLSAVHVAVPEVLNQLALGAAFAGAGIATPFAAASSADSTPAVFVPSTLAPADPPAYTAPLGG